ncbi:hypothetical protein K6U06_14590 [Acidiferrimicrobium sp. IK]|uniref:hypothetical protein n=1 Tax=Acidiferrimicrobium sp. IK TaxID=2871700 RepID=UPI0021CB6F8B|nr:hypothetical protein [Acidiferrimicrobium sp. IK]MCU4185593.1 hypothetical protein [Acidiferrimicrobium sp. IK]
MALGIVSAIAIVAAVGHAAGGLVASQSGSASYVAPDTAATAPTTDSTDTTATTGTTDTTDTTVTTGDTGSVTPTPPTTTFDSSSAEMSSNYVANPSQCGPTPVDNGQPFRPDHVYQVTATVHVWSAPSTSSTPLAEIVSTSYGGGIFGCPGPADPVVPVACKVTGQPISGPYGTESYWDQVTYDGVTGYVPDEWVNTQYDINQLPSC